MKNTFGTSLTLTLFGESHGPAVGAIIDGIAPGIPVDEARISALLSRRRPSGRGETARHESDAFTILSGVYRGKTTGTPICITIPNQNQRSGDYVYGVARPSHADYTASCKYHGFEDYRGGGHFSGRITAALVAAGGILLPALEGIGIRIGSHLLRCAGVSDRQFGDLSLDLDLLKAKHFPVLEEEAEEAMTARILEAAEAGDSVGGVIESAVTGMPAGVGEPWFDSVEGLLSHALFSIGAVKGVEFGMGFAFSDETGSRANDAFRIADGKIVTSTNHNGGINGGITNGMPLLFRVAVKPTPSIAKPQETVDFTRLEETDLLIRGRHDPAIVRRVCPVIDSVTSLVLADLLATRYGTDVLAKGVPAWTTD